MPKSEQRVSKSGTKYYYSPEAGRAYRERMKEAAIRGGWVPRPRGEGKTERRISKKTGAAYYYRPWGSLTPQQKRNALDQAKEIRAQARAYREEHGIK